MGFSDCVLQDYKWVSMNKEFEGFIANLKSEQNQTKRRYFFYITRNFEGWNVPLRLASSASTDNMAQNMW